MVANMDQVALSISGAAKSVLPEIGTTPISARIDEAICHLNAAVHVCVLDDFCDSQSIMSQ